MTLTRREMLAACAAAVPAACGLAAEKEPPRLGVVAYSFNLRLAADRAKGGGLTDPLAFVEHCQKLGAGGAQFGLGARDRDHAARLREKVESAGMFLEGQVRLPQDKADVERFAAEVRTGRECGAKVLRTVMLSGRRYETFDSADAFRTWADQATRSLALAEPVVAKHDVRLAVENHKDWRCDELLGILGRLDSKHVGVCVDTGNSIALLEDPLEVVEAYAPRAYSVHLKDMAVAEYDDGFLLAEVPLGDGFLDLKKVVGVLRKAQPGLPFCLEMITRDPLRVPCLAPKYWATFEALPGKHLARTLTMVRQHKQSLPRVGELTKERQLAAEEENVKKSLAYARKELGL